MRHKLMLGAGLVALVGSTATAQFPTAQRPIPGGFQPVSPTGGAYVAPVGGFQPVGAPVANFPTAPEEVEIPSVLGVNHPWAIKPELGAYFILVKSYVRPAQRQGREPTARELAEALAADIRTTYRVEAFLFEYITEERKAEERAKAAARRKAQVYASQLDGLRKKSQLQGMEFLAPDNRLHLKAHYHRDQIGVLVGGFKSEADAREALVKLKTWTPPKNELLMDGAVSRQPGANGKPEVTICRLNPYPTAFVVPNPAIARPGTPGGGGTRTGPVRSETERKPRLQPVESEEAVDARGEVVHVAGGDREQELDRWLDAEDRRG